MIAYTTSTVTVTMEGYEMPTTARVWVTVRQDGWPGRHVASVEVASSGRDVSDGDTMVTATFPQSETAKLVPGNARLQVNWMTSDGTRRATEPVQIAVTENLDPEVESYD